MGARLDEAVVLLLYGVVYTAAGMLIRTGLSKTDSTNARLRDTLSR